MSFLIAVGFKFPSMVTVDGSLLDLLGRLIRFGFSSISVRNGYHGRGFEPECRFLTSATPPLPNSPFKPSPIFSTERIGQIVVMSALLSLL